MECVIFLLHAAFILKSFLDELKPTAVLIEGFCDATEHIKSFAKVKPPFAVLSYTEEIPIKSVLLPFAVYSPEYVAVMWALNHNAYCEFIDLPSDVFLAISNIGCDGKGDEASNYSIYEDIANRAGFDDYDSFWEHTFEHELNTEPS